jgi:hypothetical protein
MTKSSETREPQISVLWGNIVATINGQQGRSVGLFTSCWRLRYERASVGFVTSREPPLTLLSRDVHRSGIDSAAAGCFGALANDGERTQ